MITSNIRATTSGIPSPMPRPIGRLFLDLSEAVPFAVAVAVAVTVTTDADCIALAASTINVPFFPVQQARALSSLPQQNALVASQGVRNVAREGDSIVY
jgi:hypothetical protein